LASLDYLPAVKISGKMEIPIQIVSSRRFGVGEDTLRSLRQHARLDGMSARCGVHVSIRSLAFDCAAFANRFSLTVLLPCIWKPSVLAK
jgi:hypothetical protein